MVANETATEGDFEEYWKTRSRHEKVVSNSLPLVSRHISLFSSGQKCTNHAKKLVSHPDC